MHLKELEISLTDKFYQTLGCLPNLLTSTCIGWKIMGLYGFEFKWEFTLIIIKYNRKT